MRIAYGIIGRDLTVNNITDYIQDRKLLISSPGGSLYDGWAIHDYIKGKVDEVGVVGVCASAATIIMLAAPVRWGTPNSRYLIHNPYTSIEGDSKSMEQTALDLKIEQENLLKRYIECTGAAGEKLQEIMNKNIFLTPDEAMNINLIHNIKPEIMDNLEIEKKFNFLEQTLLKIKNLFIKNLVLQDVNGKELDFGDQITEASQITVGLTATVKGNPANGEYVFSDGKTLVFENGKLTKIIEPTKETEIETLKQELETEKKQCLELKNKIISLIDENKNIKDEAAKQIEALANDFNKFKNECSSGKINVNTPPPAENSKKRVPIFM